MNVACFKDYELLQVFSLSVRIALDNFGHLSDEMKSIVMTYPVQRLSKLREVESKYSTTWMTLVHSRFQVNNMYRFLHDFHVAL